MWSLAQLADSGQKIPDIQARFPVSVPVTAYGTCILGPMSVLFTETWVEALAGISRQSNGNVEEGMELKLRTHGF